MATTDLFSDVVAGRCEVFALLHRPNWRGENQLDVLTGEVIELDHIDDIPPCAWRGQAGDEVLAVIPYRQVSERGFACIDDHAPLLAIRISEHATVPLGRALNAIPSEPIRMSDGRFDIDDEAYEATVRKVIDDEIGCGAGSNFVMKRTYLAQLSGRPTATALSAFRRLCRRESGAYWTFLIQAGDRIFIGATPERHASLRNGIATMNPISGTYRYPQSGPDLSGLLDFLGDRKEIDELHMVVDEELKMMARIRDGSCRIVGPKLREMARLAHTEYFIEGHTHADPRRILSETMFAPTVIGSPLASACAAVARHEQHGRGYYGGVAALIGRDRRGNHRMDSAILIRMAEVSASGGVALSAGATVVRHSDPAAEAAETRTKAASLLSALETDAVPLGRQPRALFAKHPTVRSVLRRRRRSLATFWLDSCRTHPPDELRLHGRTALIVDAEDLFTAMIAEQLRSLGLQVTVRQHNEPFSLRGQDLVVMGPGPGDPQDVADSKIAHLHAAISCLLDERQPFLAVCLSHQVLCRALGLQLRPCASPDQGKQRAITVFGERHIVGFYNTFAAYCDSDQVDVPGVGRVDVSRDSSTAEVHALCGPFFASLQFHAESILTRDNLGILATHVSKILDATAPTAPRLQRTRDSALQPR